MNSLAINQSFTNLRAKTTVQDIGLMDDLQDTDASVREREFLGMMAGETILDAVSLLEGLERIIAALVDKKASAEPLSSIDIDEIIEK